MYKCINCNKRKVEYKYLCNICVKNSFAWERLRDKLAAEKNYTELLKLYDKNLPEISDKNTGDFWNKKLKESERLEELDGMTNDRVKQVLKYIPKNIKNIYDIGVGNGYIEELLSKEGDYDITAIDISKDAIERLKKKIKGKFYVKSVYKINSNKKYDLVLSLEVLEHIPPHKIMKVLQTINKVVKKRGFFIVSVPMNENLEKMSDNPNSHLRIYTKNLIFSELEINGFKILNSKELFAFKKFYKTKKLLAKLFKNRWQSNNIIILSQKP